MRTAVPPQFSADDLQQLLTIELTRPSETQVVREEVSAAEPIDSAPTPPTGGSDGWDWAPGPATA
ncbi:hypothetical protein [Solicola gregarius]|uniref:Uncharacterized protein n=1 Tax=Solicola gregarius TaxID=2908642 RepID=A0AA46TFI9_9ACTN|nr:hypothetical protein [Solicola gregarius]UYM03638.1 hypothetical protein L0C25_13875 [Solicola gregarius]